MGKKGRIPQEEMDRRVAETEKIIIAKRSYLDVQIEVAKRFNVDPRTARDYIKRTKKMWKDAAPFETREEKRLEFDAILNNVIVKAGSHLEPVKDKDGTVIIDQQQTLPNGQPNPGFGRPLMMSRPKLQFILHSISQLRALWGADAPSKAEIKIDADVSGMPDVDQLPEAVAKVLREELEKISNGDLRALAGDWFHRDS